MTNSLHEQLLKAGLVDKQQLQQAQKAKQRKQKQPRGKRKQPNESARRAKAAMVKDAQRDRELNRQQQAEAQRKAMAAQIRQLIDSHGEAPGAGEIPYNFVEAGKIRRLYVTEKQQRQLSSGQTAIVKSADRYAMVPAAVADKIRQRDAGCLILLHAKEQDEDPTDPYAGYQVPDDLMW